VDPPSLPISVLVARCADRGDVTAWDEFIRRFHPVIAGRVCRMLKAFRHFEPCLAEDLVQETFFKLCDDHCRALREFAAVEENCFYGLLRATAVSVVRDHFRRIHSLKRRCELTALPIDSLPRAAIGVIQPENDSLSYFVVNEIDRILADGDPAKVQRNRFIFWLHYRDGFSFREIAELPSVELNAKGVESLVRRLKQELVRRGIDGTGRGSS
jgi:RNA polymerase sigma-70 factor (ECF subfamily)